jgi:hypothetical protein
MKAAGSSVAVAREALPAFADAMATRLRQFEGGRSFSPARYGDDWGLNFDAADERTVSASFEAFTPDGERYISELRAAGFFDREIG